MIKNIKTEVKIHNKFHIEVRDSRSGELKSTRFAENIVTDIMFNQLVEFKTFFDRISVGRGIGTPSPSNYVMFDGITSKVCEDYEKIIAYPVSNVTKIVTFGVGELTGETITEVGIGYYTQLYTHAIIKDSEGLPLGVYKGELDVLTIYATVFFELIEDPEAKIKLSKVNNGLSSLFVSNMSNASIACEFGSIGGESEFNIPKKRIIGFNIKSTKDLVNKKSKFYYRLPKNIVGDIREIYLLGRFTPLARINIDDPYIYTSTQLNNINIGIGDSVKKEFDLIRYGINNLIINMDGSIVNDYTSTTPYWEYKQIMDLQVNQKEEKAFTSKYFSSQSRYTSGEEFIFEFNPLEINGMQLEINIPFDAYYYSPKIYGSVDGIDYDLILDRKYKVTEIHNIEITQPYKYIKIVTQDGRDKTKIYWKNLITPKIIFNEAPPVGAVIKASYEVPYIAKTEDNVLDINFEIQWS